MKRLIFIFLLILLPFQFSWAAAASYCQHEVTVDTQHFGHHSHHHDAQADQQDKDSKIVKFDADCGYCHLSCQASFLTFIPEVALPTGSTYAELPVRTFSSHIPDGLHRPDWRLVA